VKEVTIPESVISISGGAFWCCCGLTSITILNKIISIGEGVFSYCVTLTEIHCKNPIPPDTGVSCFEHINNEVQIYVPKGSKEVYQKAWGFENIIEE